MGQESAEADAGVREGFSTSFARRSRWLERELKELHRASERLKLASALFDFAELNRWILDRYRDTFGLENPLTNDCYWPGVAGCNGLVSANSGHPQQDVVLRPLSMSRDQPGAGSAVERFASPGTITAKKRWHSPDIDQFSNQLDKGLGDHRSGGEPPQLFRQR